MTHPTDIHTGVTHREADVLEAFAKGKHVLECGSWHGFSTVVMARVAESVVAVDWHHGDPHAGIQDTEGVFRGNLERYGVADRVSVIVGRFEAVLPDLPRGAFDVAFTDGMHDAPSVRRDLDLIAPLIRPGGVLLVHDYDVPVNWNFQVHETVDSWLAANPRWRLTSTTEKLAVLEDVWR